MTTYQFLSDPWLEEVKELIANSKVDKQGPDAKINLVVNEVPNLENGQFFGHIDTTAKTLIVEKNHLDNPDLTVTLNYDTAKDIFIKPDPSVVMSHLMMGKLLLEGNTDILMGMQANLLNPDPETQKLQNQIAEITEI